MLKFLTLFIATFVATMTTTTAFAQKTPVETLQPIRQTTAKISITKFQIAKSPTGEYVWTGVPVCQKDTMINVYDGRGKGSFGYSNNPVIECDTEIGGLKSKMIGTASVVLRDQQIFTGEPVSEIRSNSFSLDSVDILIPAAKKFISTAQVLSRDLSATALLTADQGLNWDCTSGTCTAPTTETFMATVEFGP